MEVDWRDDEKQLVSEVYIAHANCPETSGTVPDLLALSRVPHGSCYLLSLSRKQG